MIQVSLQKNLQKTVFFIHKFKDFLTASRSRGYPVRVISLVSNFRLVTSEGMSEHVLMSRIWRHRRI